MDAPIIYRQDLEAVDWEELKATLAADDFDNGRSPSQLRTSFINSHLTCVAYADDRIVGTARALSDGICNAYVVDVWTLSSYRGRGIANTMMKLLLDRLPGQHVVLFTDGAVGLYQKLGFTETRVGMAKVVGRWLETGR